MSGRQDRGSSDAFVRWIATLRDRAHHEGRKRGFSRSVVLDAIDQLVDRYTDRFTQQRIHGPLKDLSWKPELNRLCSELTEKKRIAPYEALLTHADTNQETDSALDEAKLRFDDAISRFASAQQSTCYFKYNDTGRIAPRSPEDRLGLSPPRFSENVHKALNVGVAGALVLTLEQPAESSLLLHPYLGAQGALSAGVFRAFDAIVAKLDENQKRALEPGALRVWDGVSRQLIDLLRTDKFQPYELYTIPTCFLALFCVAKLLRDSLRPAWESTWAMAEKRGLLANPHTRRQLASIGCYVGSDSNLIEFLRSPESRELELSCTLLFVDGGARSSLIPFQSILQGRSGDAITSAGKRPFRGVRQLVDYASSCLKNRRYDNEGLQLMVLRWLSDALEYLGPLPETDAKRLSIILNQEKGRLSHGLVRPVIDRLHHRLAGSTRD